MNSILKAALLPFLAAAVLSPAEAQPQSGGAAQPRAAAPNPADPMAAVPAVDYRSALGRYRPFSEAEVAPWRKTNELVRQPGGLGEAGEPAGPAASGAHSRHSQ